MEGVLARHHHHLQQHQLHLHPSKTRLDGANDELVETAAIANEWNARTAEVKDGSDRDRTMALLVSESAFTKSALIRAFSSPMPFLLVHLLPSDSEIESGTCNHTLKS